MRARSRPKATTSPRAWAASRSSSLRKTEDEIGVLVNRCAHRGSMVCAEGRGNTERFVCPYHGWSYDRAGILQAVPFASGYEKGKLPAGLKAVPRVTTYRGFIFASLAPQGEDLRNLPRPGACVVRRFRRPRARRRARGRGRRVQARLQRQLEADAREPPRRRASGLGARLLGGGGAQRRPSPASRARSTTTTSRCARCARTARPIRCGKRSACGPRRTATATWATTMTTAASSPDWATRSSTSTEKN